MKLSYGLKKLRFDFDFTWLLFHYHPHLLLDFVDPTNYVVKEKYMCCFFFLHFSILCFNKGKHSEWVHIKHFQKCKYSHILNISKCQNYPKLWYMMERVQKTNTNVSAKFPKLYDCRKFVLWINAGLPNCLIAISFSMAFGVVKSAFLSVWKCTKFDLKILVLGSHLFHFRCRFKLIQAILFVLNIFNYYFLFHLYIA